MASLKASDTTSPPIDWVWLTAGLTADEAASTFTKVWDNTTQAFEGYASTLRPVMAGKDKSGAEYAGDVFTITTTFDTAKQEVFEKGLEVFIKKYCSYFIEEESPRLLKNLLNSADGRMARMQTLLETLVKSIFE
jgi:hypothetical protein